VPESAPRPIGHITLDAKRTGKRRTGNPFAPFDVAGAGDGLTANLYGVIEEAALKLARERLDSGK